MYFTSLSINLSDTNPLMQFLTQQNLHFITARNRVADKRSERKNILDNVNNEKYFKQSLQIIILFYIS